MLHIRAAVANHDRGGGGGGCMRLFHMQLTGARVACGFFSQLNQSLSSLAERDAVGAQGPCVGKHQITIHILEEHSIFCDLYQAFLSQVSSARYSSSTIPSRSYSSWTFEKGCIWFGRLLRFTISPLELHKQN